jgi:predicted GNAT family N-acyltransferase
MADTNSCIIRLADWEKDQVALQFIRRTVFIEEQCISEEAEWDEYDAVSQHFLAEDSKSGKPLGTARLLPDGHIGRVAVLPEYRRMKIGGQLMQAAIKEAEERGMKTQVISAQTHAIPFYDHLGFCVISGEYDDCGIPHVNMTRKSHQ